MKWTSQFKGRVMVRTFSIVEFFYCPDCIFHFQLVFYFLYFSLLSRLTWLHGRVFLKCVDYCKMCKQRVSFWLSNFLAAFVAINSIHLESVEGVCVLSTVKRV